MDTSEPMAIITGASSGIGAEYARRLAAKGLNLLVSARRKELLIGLKEELEKEHQVMIEVFTADLSQQGDIERLASKISEFENIHYMINNAGFTNIGSFENVAIEKHRAMMMVHVNASVELTYAALPGMLEKNHGIVINVASVAGLSKSSRGSIYGPTKAFLVYFSHSLHKQLKKTNIVVQALCPGYTYSGFHQTEEYKSVGKNPYKTTPKFLWMSAEEVVDYSLKKTKKKQVVVIPGLKYRIITRLIRWGIIRR